jgi:PIN domain nuclease of toxin-antitoxin system
MAILLDTQVLIWLEESPSLISERLRERISNEANTFFSMSSVWEMAIKLKTGKLSIAQPLAIFVDGLRKDYSFKLLEISLDHVYHTQQLPLHHRDPFDRLLISQSIVESIPIISSDSIFDAYGIERVW